MSYLEFEFNGTSESGKTKRWIVKNAQLNHVLGWIEWKASWHKYWFCPVNGVGFDSTCLNEIFVFLSNETRHHKGQVE